MTIKKILNNENITKNFEEKKHALCMLITFVICLLGKGTVLSGTHNLYLYGDEFGPLDMASYLAGNDWTNVASDISAYYGYGYYGFMFWLFKLTDNYRVIYISISIIDIFITSAICILIYSIVSNIVLKKDGAEAIVITVIVSVSYSYSCFIRNEQPAFVLVWIICKMLILCVENNNNKKKNMIFSVLTAVLIGYSISVHERLVALFIAVLIVAIIFRLLNYRTINILAFSISGVAVYTLGRTLRERVVQVLFSSKETAELLNTAVINVDSINTFSITSVKGMLILFFTNLYEAIMSSYGILACTILIIIILGIKTIKNQDGELLEEYIRVYFPLLVFFLCVIVVICGLAFNHGGYIMIGIEKKQVVQSFKALFYERYYSIFMGPVMAFSLGLLPKIDVKKLANFMILVVVGLYKWILMFVFPYISTTTYVGKSLGFAPIIYTWVAGDTYSKQLKNTAISVCVLILLLYLLGRNKQNTRITFYVLVLWLALPHGLSYTVPEIQTNFDEIYSLIQTLEDEIELPDEIYSNGYQKLTAQFVFNRYKIILDSVPDDESDVIYISNVYEGEKKGFYYIELGESEYIYFRGENLVEEVSRYYTLKKIE